MKSYMMQMQTLIGGLQWEYRFQIANEEMAKEYTVKYLSQKGALPDYCRSVILWDMDLEMFIADYAVDTLYSVHELHNYQNRRLK